MMTRAPSHTVIDASPSLPPRHLASIVVGSCLLALRVPGTLVAPALTLLVGAIGLGISIGASFVGGDDRPHSQRLFLWLTVTVIGCVTFACARFVGVVHPGPIWWPAVAASVLAAVAEEAFFRRLVYGALAVFGPGAAIVSAAALFAVVHVPAYGPEVLLIDFAAGVLLGWQRWVSGGWSAPAATHAAANLLGFGW
jgi:membrane protease YdiL (CAAX protease family)